MTIHSLDLNHYSAQPLGEIYSREQGKCANTLYKPKGLWVSVDNEESNWHSWCMGEQFGLDNLVNKTKIILSKDSHILHLTTPEQIDDFSIIHALDHEINHRSFKRVINWKEVAELYQGIIISPYQWNRRYTNHTFWYYGWDCASGCIWDKDAIERTEVIYNERKNSQSESQTF